MRCKIVRTQKLMWRNIIRSTKSQKVLILHYSINVGLDSHFNTMSLYSFFYLLSLRSLPPRRGGGPLVFMLPSFFDGSQSPQTYIL